MQIKLICESVAENFTKKAGQQPGHIFMGYGIKTKKIF